MSDVYTSTADVWSGVIGQPDAVAQLQAAVAHPVHAYLFVGPPGSGKRAALRAFAAELLAAGVDDPADADRHRRLALAEHHPDLEIIEPTGPLFRGGKPTDGTETEAVRFARLASRAPVEAARKVVVAIDFHLANPAAVGRLLKTIEEPPPATIVVVVETEVPPEQATIASRCARIEFTALSEDVVRDRLVAEGVEADRAADASAVASGDLERARLLATDERLHLRVATWRDVAHRLDGTGATVCDVVDELRGLIDDAQGPLDARQSAEAEELQERIERYGERGSGAKALGDRHRRESRALRTQELRLGLATLARTYRDELAASARPGPLLDGLDAIQVAAEALERNPNETLLLQSLLLRLPPLPR